MTREEVFTAVMCMTKSMPFVEALRLSFAMVKF